MVHPRADAALLRLANATDGGLTFNGDDAVGVALPSSSSSSSASAGERGWAVLDAVGVPGGQLPGSWAVLGVEGASQDHTLLRPRGRATGGSG